MARCEHWRPGKKKRNKLGKEAKILGSLYKIASPQNLFMPFFAYLIFGMDNRQFFHFYASYFRLNW